MKIKFKGYRNLNNEVSGECCGQEMIVKNQRAKHLNDNPFTMKCLKCGRKFKGNAHFYTSPIPHHSVTELEECK